ncbi:GNAT family N-acetyltransferase [Pedobacter jamesrossensis]|uniref:GNAT family N-acetyltransferase n=1 Tax=Pedobacter jamesrossensis TaxID=1908238 RepID=UPI0036221156
MEIRNLLPSDWAAVKSIYEKGITTGNATFHTSAPSWKDWDTSHLQSCRIVVEDNGILVGWAALTPVSSRCVYAGVAEVSVYVEPERSGKGIGLALLNELITLSEADGIWTLQAGYFLKILVAFASMKRQVSEPLVLGKRLANRMGSGGIQCYWKEEVTRLFNQINL